MKHAWDTLIGLALGTWWGYWVGAQCHTDTLWKMNVITFVSGMGVTFTVVWVRAMMRQARERRKEVARMVRRLQESPDYGKTAVPKRGPHG